MPVNYNAAVVDAVVSVWVKLPEEVRGKVIEATNRLIDFSKGISEDTTGQVSGAVNEIYEAFPAEVQRGVIDTLEAIITNIEE